MAQLETYKGYYLWNYVPSQAAAVIFLLLFLGATAYHAWRIWKQKTYFCICFAISGFCTAPSKFPSRFPVPSFPLPSATITTSYLTTGTSKF
jgi:hypothetical protein